MHAKQRAKASSNLLARPGYCEGELTRECLDHTLRSAIPGKGNQLVRPWAAGFAIFPARVKLRPALKI